MIRHCETAGPTEGSEGISASESGARVFCEVILPPDGEVVAHSFHRATGKEFVKDQEAE
jgi:hypothetical protein